MLVCIAVCGPIRSRERAAAGSGPQQLRGALRWEGQRKVAGGVPCTLGVGSERGGADVWVCNSRFRLGRDGLWQSSQIQIKRGPVR
jgi:hypothetical protein